ncbi:hypothetical protein [Methylobacterium soli]|uniref:Uncharacterized protein n=1 Tax=Methylobacterium soli TaxID=553447 RepID=A0A6L3SXB3_9HYPH|nr:hypothetical protein [Methylobacterium soli]KAB1077253.1 hypothetical protein F6X53_19365 [Methylobacterium soli]GJE46804.1 hypothetical protein AEGHOMDF_6013 [Methylobacterium soli]
MRELVLATVLTATPVDIIPVPFQLPLSVHVVLNELLWLKNPASEIDCKGRRCSTDFALSMEVKERPAGTPEQRLRSEVARKDHPGGEGRIIGPVHRVGRLWTARWDRGFVSLVEVGERDLWLWLVPPADPDGADREWEEVSRDELLPSAG